MKKSIRPKKTDAFFEKVCCFYHNKICKIKDGFDKAVKFCLIVSFDDDRKKTTHSIFA